MVIAVGGLQVVCCGLLGFWLGCLRLLGGWQVGIVARFMYYCLCGLVSWFDLCLLAVVWVGFGLLIWLFGVALHVGFG